MTKEILIKFLNNQCSESELYEVIQWAKTEALNEEGRNLGFDDWNNYQLENELENNEKFTALFDNILIKIDRIDQEHIIGRNKIKAFSVFTSRLTRVAAVLLIPVLVYLFYTLSERNIVTKNFATLAVDSLEVIAPVGSRTVVQLSDGSVVHLNYGSKIKYPQFFSDNIREITLSGEAFFDVTHNLDNPFIVKTGKINVKVLGTSFNVQAYSDNEIVQTTLVNGRVVLEQIANNGDTKMLGSMEPGQHVAFNTQTGAMSSTKGNVQKYISWKDGKLIFEDTPLFEVAKKLSRMFNVDIQVDKNIEEFIYSVTFVDEPLFQILDLMAIATPIQYTTLPRKKLTDGTYSKQTIIIEKKKI